MPAQITIIGLGQIGASVGLALANRKDLLTRMGHDKEYPVAQKAQKLGAVDNINYNLPASVREADIILLALPMNGMRETLEMIGKDIKEGAVVLDTSPVKIPVLEWVKKYLPANCHYVGLVPALNPSFLHDTKVGLDAASADMFQKSVMGIVAAPGTSGDAIKLATDLTQLLGAKAFFLDLVEADSLMAGMHILPQLMAAALANATSGQPGWLEARKIAGRAYASSSSAIYNQDTLAALRDEAMLNKQNLLRVMDNYLSALLDLKKTIADDDTTNLAALLEEAFDARDQWWGQREKGDWESVEVGKKTGESQSMGTTLRQMFLGKWGKDKK